MKDKTQLEKLMAIMPSELVWVGPAGDSAAQPPPAPASHRVITAVSIR